MAANLTPLDKGELTVEEFFDQVKDALNRDGVDDFSPAVPHILWNLKWDCE